MKFRLVDTGWDRVLDESLHADGSEIRIVCPFIKTGAAQRLLKRGRPKVIQVITRFSLGDFFECVSDIAALRLLFDNGAQIRGVRHLHAKVYIFGTGRAIVTSANLTDAALRRNHEFGFVATDTSVVARCRQFFDGLWGRAGKDVSASRLTDWEREITSRWASGARLVRAAALTDEGVYAGVSKGITYSPDWADEAEQAFVKFFGEGHNRVEHSFSVREEVERAGCHWACTYPKGKRPRQARDGAVMFMGRIVENPNDILIFGRAVAMHYETGRDDATAADIQLRDWKKRWPHYVRVHHAEFVDGTLSNGVSLNELMDALGANSFASTQRNAARGQGNTDPRKAYRQLPAVELSPQGLAWMNEHVENAFTRHGRLAPSVLSRFDWPKVQVQAQEGTE
jgi:hypothetical protein